MKKYLFIILLALVSLSGQAKKHKQLVILHTNDTHSAILPINEQLPDTMKPICSISIVATSSRVLPISPCLKAMWK